MAHEEDNIDTSMVAVVGVISAGLSFALIFLLMVLFYAFDNEQAQTVTETPNAEAERVWSEQAAILNEAAWVNQETGQVRVPVTSAMKFVVAQLQENPEDAGVNPPQFADSDATITDTGNAAAAAEEKPADAGGEQPATNDGSTTEESTEAETAPKAE